MIGSYIKFIPFEKYYIMKFQPLGNSLAWNLLASDSLSTLTLPLHLLSLYFYSLSTFTLPLHLLPLYFYSSSTFTPSLLLLSLFFHFLYNRLYPSLLFVFLIISIKINKVKFHAWLELNRQFDFEIFRNFLPAVYKERIESVAHLLVISNNWRENFCFQRKIWLAAT